MKLSRTPVLLGLALLASAPLVNAQIISRTFNVTGVSNGVVSRFTIWINADNNTLVVDIDNARPLTNGLNTKVGTITGFGFNTPFNVNGVSSVLTQVQWDVVNSGHTGLPTVFPVTQAGKDANDDFWNERDPYSLNPNFSNDFGVEAGNPGRGIEYGEKATFVFAFTQDITVTNFVGFFDNNATTTNKYDFTVRWQEVGKKSDYGLHGDNCVEDSDKGGWDGIPFSDGDLPPVPEPSTYGFMGAAALLGLVARRRHLAKKAKN